MGRKIKAIDATTGKVFEIDEDQIVPGHIRNDSLPEPLLARIRDIHSRIKHVYDVNLEQFEIPFMRESHPEKEVAKWDAIVAGFEKVTTELPDVDQKIVLRTLLIYSMDSLSVEELADPVVKKIVEVVERG